NAATLGFEFRTLVVPVRSVLIASFLGVIASLAAGILPAVRASQTSPIAAVQRQEDEPSTRQAWLGLALVALGTFRALYPWEGAGALRAGTVALGLFFAGVSLAAPAILAPALALLKPVLLRSFGAAGRLGASFAQR